MKQINKKILKINRDNDIESIIENFQQYEKKYEIRISTLDDGIQYEVKDMKIAQTYKSTILETDINDLTRKLKNKGHITIVVIDNIHDKNENEIIKRKIEKINNDTTRQREELVCIQDIFWERKAYQGLFRCQRDRTYL